MKARSALLIVFMVAVPAVAMFSHRIPADVRRAMRTRIGRLVESWATTAAPARDATVPPARPAGVQEAVARVAGPPAADASGLPASANATLSQLGAVGFECRVMAGGVGAHQATCSVPLDASGQLVRVFHATGVDGPAATAALIADVAAWRDRTASVRAGAIGHAAEPPRRF